MAAELGGDASAAELPLDPNVRLTMFNHVFHHMYDVELGSVRIPHRTRDWVYVFPYGCLPRQDGILDEACGAD
eukprot:3282433-Pyramimonas_sp.AAC.1